MILLTGNGAFATAFRQQQPCDIVSVRSLPEQELEHVLGKYDTVIHNSANLRCASHEEAIRDNFDLTRRVLDNLARIKPGARFIYLSSMSMLKDEYSYAAVEDMSLYAFSKYLGEIYCLRHPLQNISCVRFSTLFCSNPSKDGLSKLLSDAVQQREITLINNGAAKRDFIPLDIAAQYVAKLAEPGRPYKKIYNIAAGEATSFAEAAAIAAAHIPGLKTGNKTMEGGADILHRFSATPMEELGRIHFSLEEYIAGYIKQLRENAGTCIQ